MAKTIDFIYTKEFRRHVYREIVTRLVKDSVTKKYNSICYYLIEAIQDVSQHYGLSFTEVYVKIYTTPGGIMHFKELRQQKPWFRSINSLWFPLNPKGFIKRFNILSRAILKTYKK